MARRPGAHQGRGAAAGAALQGGSGDHPAALALSSPRMAPRGHRKASAGYAVAIPLAVANPGRPTVGVLTPDVAPAPSATA